MACPLWKFLEFLMGYNQLAALARIEALPPHIRKENLR